MDQIGFSTVVLFKDYVISDFWPVAVPTHVETSSLGCYGAAVVSSDFTSFPLPERIADHIALENFLQALHIFCPNMAKNTKNKKKMMAVRIEFDISVNSRHRRWASWLLKAWFKGSNANIQSKRVKLELKPYTRPYDVVTTNCLLSPGALSSRWGRPRACSKTSLFLTSVGFKLVWSAHLRLRFEWSILAVSEFVSPLYHSLYSEFSTSSLIRPDSTSPHLSPPFAF